MGCDAACRDKIIRLALMEGWTPGRLPAASESAPASTPCGTAGACAIINHPWSGQALALLVHLTSHLHIPSLRYFL